ncbi:hypothetical protein BBK36DRAFT_1171223 [Trichoderma citrinoviride]|uniref:Uncharacterized protein n=1 Tax=Trichoderma citrinoviride TaxID=58853 RepID=A0A2T4B381_9HYPO|nr:hypothetical protein BBK36DRAFT_1171223 [Trichoderma citrinoviride]PTB63760.1 hypothetical protein BBK36DRAFT_1171223 [Trichoderma citrinoviride]
MSSRSANYYGNSKDNDTHGAQSATFRHVPDSPSYNLDRFALGQPQSRPPPGLSKKKAEAKAVAQAEARASALIRAFDTRFNNANRPPKQ